MSALPGQVRFDVSALEGITLRAARAGLAAAGVVVQTQIKVNLNRQGTPTGKGGDSGWDALARGNNQLAIRDSILSVIGSRGGLSGSVRNRADRLLDQLDSKLSRLRSRKSASRDLALAESVRGLGGLVDPPGGMPRKRTGTLQKSIRTIAGDSPLEVFIGSNLRYAAAQEWGASLPGGQPYLFIKGKIVYLRRGKKGMGVTKPSRLPARPYLRPSLKQARDDAFAAFCDKAASIINTGGKV